MKEQLKAEAFVRSQRPALMELSFGCEVDTGVKRVVLEKRFHTIQTYAGGMVFTNKVEQFFNFTIIGHKPQLQDWLAVLHKQTGYRVTYSTYGQADKKGWGYIQTSCLTAHQVKSYSTVIGFDVDETGQPATEADYKLFNDIVGT